MIEQKKIFSELYSTLAKVIGLNFQLNLHVRWMTPFQWGLDQDKNPLDIWQPKAEPIWWSHQGLDFS